MARTRTDNIENQSLGGGFDPIPKGEYDVLIMEIKRDDAHEFQRGPRAGVEVNKLQIKVGVASSEYEERLLWGRFNLAPVDQVKADAIRTSLPKTGKDSQEKYDKSVISDELKMEKFMNAIGLDDRCETELPDEISWLSPATIDWLMINGATAGLRVDVYVTKPYKKGDGTMSDAGNAIGDYGKYGVALPKPDKGAAKSTGQPATDGTTGVDNSTDVLD